MSEQQQEQREKVSEAKTLQRNWKRECDGGVMEEWRTELLFFLLSLFLSLSVRLTVTLYLCSLWPITVPGYREEGSGMLWLAQRNVVFSIHSGFFFPTGLSVIFPLLSLTFLLSQNIIFRLLWTIFDETDSWCYLKDDGTQWWNATQYSYICVFMLL